MCTIIFWDTLKKPLLKYPIETVRQMKTLCQLYGFELEELLYDDEEHDLGDYGDDEECLCGIGIYDTIILNRLGITYETFDDGSITILDYLDPPVPPESRFRNHIEIDT